MKYKIWAIAATTVAIFVLIISLHTVHSQNSRQERRSLRAEARQERYARETRYIDSLVLSKDWQFTPITISQFAGPTQSIFRNYYVEMFNNSVQVYLPYYKGYVNQYLTILNFDIWQPENYSIEKSTDGWHVVFSGTDFTGNTYTFDFNISTPSGQVELELRSTFYNTVSYSGSIN
jgi:hypothetical protein